MNITIHAAACLHHCNHLVEKSNTITRPGVFLSANKLAYKMIFPSMVNKKKILKVQCKLEYLKMYGSKMVPFSCTHNLCLVWFNVGVFTWESYSRLYQLEFRKDKVAN